MQMHSIQRFNILSIVGTECALGFVEEKEHFSEIRIRHTSHNSHTDPRLGELE
jgi:hypothetical protein